MTKHRVMRNNKIVAALAALHPMDTDGKFSMAAGMSNRVIEQMLTAYNFNSYYDKKNAIKKSCRRLFFAG